MRLKTGDEVMYEGEMFTVLNISASMAPLYHLLDEEGEPHPDGPFTKAQLRECPVK